MRFLVHKFRVPIHYARCAKNLAPLFCAILFLAPGPAASQEKNPGARDRIRDAALNHSQIMEMVSHLRLIR